MRKAKQLLILFFIFVGGALRSVGQIIIEGQTVICDGSSVTLSVGAAPPTAGNCTSSLYMSSGTTYLNCGDVICFYDSGGPNGEYDYDEGYIRTFRSNDNSPVSITFSFVDIEETYEELQIYNGTYATGTLLNGNNLYNGLAGRTYTAQSGVLTIAFLSDDLLCYDGWEAKVYCGNSTHFGAAPSNCTSSVNMRNGTTTITCGNAICFYDSGGSNGSYADNEGYVHTFRSSTNEPISITFNSVSVEDNYDEIYLYNGTNTSGTLLNNGNTYNGLAGNTFTATSGSLTVYFSSDVSNVFDGWSAIVYCASDIYSNYSYHWSTGATTPTITVSPTTTTTYSVTVTGPDIGTLTASTTISIVQCDNSGCPSVSPAEFGTGLTNIVVDCDVTEVTLDANAVATAATANNYTVSSISYAPPYGYMDGNRIFTDARDDYWSEVVNLPFAFCYYGSTYTQVVAGANSVATFDIDVAGGWCEYGFDESIPNTNLFHNTIFACYRDIDPRVSYFDAATGNGGIYEGVLGQYPCRSYVLSFNNVALFYCTDVRTFSSMIVLYEGTNIIDIYLRDAPTCLDWNDGNGIIGLQNSTGTIGITAPGRNTGPWTAHEEAWRFVPTGTPVYTVTWYEGNGIDGPVLGTGDVITVSPTVSTDYTARLQYTACNGSTFDITNTCHVTVNNSSPTVSVTASPDYLCANSPTTLTATSTGATSYQWSTGATGSTTTAYPTTDPTTYTVTVGYSNGCHSLGSVTVHLDQTPPEYNGNVGPIDASVNGCVSTVPNLINLVRPYCSDDLTPNGNLTITQSPTAGSTITGNTTVTLTVSDACGNATEVAVQVTVPDLPALQLVEQRDILCYGASTGYLSVLASGGLAPYTYSWSAATPSNPINGHVGPSANSLQADTYTITATDNNGCEATQAYTIQYLSQPMLAGTLSEDQLICSGGTSQPLSVTGSSGGADSYYVWQQSSNGVTFTNVTGAGNSSSYSPGHLSQNTCYRVAYTSDSCGVAYTNTVCITIGTPVHIVVEDVVCYGVAYVGNGFNIPATSLTTPGLYSDSLALQTADGCDSVVILNLTVWPPVTATDERTIVENELPYTWNGIVFTSEGMQTVTLTDVNGCDSTVTMILHVNPNQANSIDTAVCANSFPLTWYGLTFTAAGTQTAVYPSALGADSTVYYTVNVIPLQFVTVTDAVCQNESYDGYGFSVTTVETSAPGILEMSRTLEASTGCDSTVTLQLTVNRNYEQQIEAVACDSYEWHGQVYQQSGTYSVTLTSSAGCDSVEILNLTVHPSVTGTDVQTIVENDLPYTWNGVVFTEEGVQTAVLTNANGCDSTVTMTLHVIPNVFTSIDTTVCESALPLQWQGVYFTEAGTQSVIYPTTLGADSTVTMTVNVIASQFMTVRDEVCQYEPYSGYGFEVTEEETSVAGVLEREQLYLTDLGCDSTVTLLLTVNPNYVHYFEVVACDSMVWNGQVYRQTGVYTQSFSSSHGCDSTVTKEVEVVNTALELVNHTPDFCEDFEAELEVITDLDHIVWSTGEENVHNIVAHHAGAFVVTANTAQCHAFDRIVIPACAFNLYIPNAITPSSEDGNNDYFCLPEGILSQIETFEIGIFDRWGRVVFQSDNPHFRWDGREKGKLKVNNTYAYYIKLTVYGGGSYLYKGIVTVL